MYRRRGAATKPLRFFPFSMEPKQNVIEIGPDGIKKSLNKVLRGWAKQYAKAEKKGPQGRRCGP